MKLAAILVASATCQPAMVETEVSVYCQSGIPVAIEVRMPAAGKTAISVREAVELCQQEPAGRT